MNQIQFDIEFDSRKPDVLDRFNQAVNSLIAIPRVQVWIEDDDQIRVALVPPVFNGIGSDWISYDKGWLVFRKKTQSEYLHFLNTKHITVFFPQSEEEVVHSTLDHALQNIPVKYNPDVIN